MKEFLLLACFFAVQSVLADDTEIYGTNGVNSDTRINSNVLFVLDTSGSMDEPASSVSDSKPPYDAGTSYSGSYDADKFYHKHNADPSDGHSFETFTQSSRLSDWSNCTNTISTLNSYGLKSGRYRQAKLGRDGSIRSWDNLKDGSDNPIRCTILSGKTYTLYTGNYLNYSHDDTYEDQTRLQVVKNVVNELTHSLSNINLGLMRFDSNSDGGFIDVPVSDITTSGPLIRTKLDGYEADGATPLEETFYEAVRYYRSESWMFGDNSKPRSSDPSSLQTGTTNYQSPISDTCQKNHIILLTDGAPTEDRRANNDIRGLLPRTLPSGLNSNCSGDGNCMDELAYWARNSDHSSTLDGTQDITTYTIAGFSGLGDSEKELLEDVAYWGGGRYFSANNTADLTRALNSIFLEILATDSTFTAPAVSVNAFNASEHRDELFYALFRPSNSVKWAGNVKRYQLNSSGTVIDANDNDAINQSTGFFNEDIFDLWNNTETADGKNVGLGGAANRFLVPSARSIFTNTDTGNLVLLSSSGAATKESYNMTSADDEDFTEVLNWSLGKDVVDFDNDDNLTEARQQLGDPLHSEPVVITYGGTDDNPDSTLFFGTNEGFIHAISTETGEEEFAFLPREFHSSQNIYFNNTDSTQSKPYGMDGLITSWFYDKNRNNLIINPETNQLEEDEHIYLYAGMRRGGSGYYALDVTDRSNPEMLFKIEGVENIPANSTNPYRKLGQTWSKMTVAKINTPDENGVLRETPVLFFGGGYDESQDDNPTRQSDSVGNAIFMVHAQTGDLLGWVSNENSGADIIIDEMVNSIPASLSVVDINSDGLTDYLFAADMGGRVFRIDFPDGSTVDATGGMIANLNDGTVENNRRFYNKPNVALVKDRQRGDYLTIAIGSGHRAHPVQTTAVNNRFYVIKDFHPYTAPSSYTTKTEAATTKTSLAENESPDSSLLYNATSLMTGGASEFTNDMPRIMADGGGWYVTFSTAGEKVLAESTTFSGAIIFTTFSPTGSISNACGADTGLSKTYVLDQKNAMAVIDLDGDGDVDADDASKSLSHSGIAPRPVVIYRSGGGKTIAIGTETIDDSRFTPKPKSDCPSGSSCETDKPKCLGANCYVKPMYWRQNN